MITDAGAKQLSAAIVLQAVKDINDIYRQAMAVRRFCRKGKLGEHLQGGGQKSREKMQMFSERRCSDIARFLSSGWGRNLLAICDIEEISAEMMEKITVIDIYGKRCTRCISRILRDIANEVDYSPVEKRGLQCDILKT